MTVFSALKEKLENILDNNTLDWLVAIAPPAGYDAPCIGIVSWRLRSSLRTSLTNYPILDVEFVLSGVNEPQADMAIRIFRTLAETRWEAEQMVAIHGRLADYRVERDDNARQEWWVVYVTIEYQVILVED